MSPYQGTSFDVQYSRFSVEKKPRKNKTSRNPNEVKNINLSRDTVPLMLCISDHTRKLSDDISLRNYTTVEIKKILA